MVIVFICDFFEVHENSSHELAPHDLPWNSTELGTGQILQMGPNRKKKFILESLEISQNSLWIYGK